MGPRNKLCIVTGLGITVPRVLGNIGMQNLSTDMSVFANYCVLLVFNLLFC